MRNFFSRGRRQVRVLPRVIFRLERQMVVVRGDALWDWEGCLGHTCEIFFIFGGTCFAHLYDLCICEGMLPMSDVVRVRPKIHN